MKFSDFLALLNSKVVFNSRLFFDQNGLQTSSWNKTMSHAFYASIEGVKIFHDSTVGEGSISGNGETWEEALEDLVSEINILYKRGYSFGNKRISSIRPTSLIKLNSDLTLQDM